MKHEMLEFEIPTMNLDSIANHRDEANLKATSKPVIHGQPEFQYEEKSEKVITNKTAVTGKVNQTIIVIRLTGLNHSKIFVQQQMKGHNLTQTRTV